MPARECSRTACSQPAVSSLTFVYQDSTAVLGPLSRLSEPHAYDLCHEHAARMTPPRGWELLRVAGGEDVSDDLVALADAVRGPVAPAPHGPVGTPDAAPRGTSRAGRHDPRDAGGRAAGRPAERDRHLHVIRNSDD
ncbi:DUF3499 domain-containing protein [Brachybacterium paraconglomeratum]